MFKLTMGKQCKIYTMYLRISFKNKLNSKLLARSLTDPTFTQRHKTHGYNIVANIVQ